MDIEATSRYIAFDAVEIDLIGRRVTVAGTEVTLEPKAFEVLALLAQAPGKAFTRDEILDAVWGHRHVTPGVLNRVVVLIRQALGENAENAQYLRTLHGVGYRLDAQMRSPSRLQETEVAPPIPAEPADIGTHLPAKSDPASSYDAPVPQGTTQRTTAPSAPRPANRMARALTMATAIALVLAAIIAPVTWYAQSRARKAETPATMTLAVAPLLSRTGDEKLRDAAEGFAESLIDSLGKMKQVRVLGRDSTFAVARGLADTSSLAEQLDADYVLGGEIEEQHDALAVIVTLSQRGRQAVVWTHSANVSRGALFSLLAPTVERVRATLSPGDTASPASTPAGSAQDLYWLGRHYWYQRTPASLARALDYFQRSATEDSRYAPAYCGIADAYLLLYEYAGVSQEEAATKARAALDRARELDPSLPELAASEGLLLFQQDRYRAAVDTYAKAAAAAPQNSRVLLWYGNALMYVGRVHEASRLHERALKLDPLSAVLQTAYGMDDMLVGEETRANDRYRRAIEIDPEFVEPYWQLAQQQLFYGHLAAAMSLYQRALRPNRANAGSAIRIAYAWLRFGDAEEALRSAEDAGQSSPIDRLDIAALALTMRGRGVDALAQVRAYTPPPSESEQYLGVLARTLALNGEDEAARAAYRRLAETDSDYLYPQMWVWFPGLIREHGANYVALLAPGSDDRRRALADYRARIDALAEGGFNLPLLIYQHAVIAALAGDTDSAERLLGQALDRGWLDAFALDAELAWRPFRGDAWLEAARTRIRERISAERAKLEATRETPGAG